MPLLWCSTMNFPLDSALRLMKTHCCICGAPATTPIPVSFMWIAFEFPNRVRSRHLDANFGACAAHAQEASHHAARIRTQVNLWRFAPPAFLLAAILGSTALMKVLNARPEQTDVSAPLDMRAYDPTFPLSYLLIAFLVSIVLMFVLRRVLKPAQKGPFWFAGTLHAPTVGLANEGLRHVLRSR